MYSERFQDPWHYFTRISARPHLYAWLTHQAFRASSNRRSRRITWRALHEQLGADYADVQNFRRKAVEAIRKIESVYPGLQLETIEGGLSVKPSSPAIPSKALKIESIVAPSTPVVVPVVPLVGKVSSKSIETAKALVLESDRSWDVYALEQEFYDYAAKKGAPKYLDKAFIGFVRRKIVKKP